MTSLTKEILVSAYASGFFPMPHPETEEICWFNPDPRAVMPLDGFHLSRSLKRSIRKMNYKASINSSFDEVIEHCSRRKETWINDEIKNAYIDLHRAGIAHSLEVWQGGILAGGLYGVSLGGAFFAESKFHIKTDASKAALYFLTEHLKDLGFKLLEVQFLTPHLSRLGAIEISGSHYLQQLSQALMINPGFASQQPKPWSF